jgi:hypothetical protein
MTKLSYLVAVTVVLGAGCSKKKEGAGGGAAAAGSCKPLAVTVDGAPLAAMPNGLARSNKMSGDVTYEVQMFNHDKASCGEMLSKSGRQVPDGEVSVRAFAGGSGMMGKGVGIDAHTQAGGNVSLASPKPKAPGDIVKVCVENVSFTPQVGDLKGKKVTVTGLFEGTFCGELTF